MTAMRVKFMHCKEPNLLKIRELEPHMNELFITGININHVRHLHNSTIELSKSEKKHVFLTGKNGSGKTALLEAINAFLTGREEDGGPVECSFNAADWREQFRRQEIAVVFRKAGTPRGRFFACHVTHLTPSVPLSERRGGSRNRRGDISPSPFGEGARG